jgi:hypothetical protein
VVSCVNAAVTLIQAQRPPAERRRSDLTRVAAVVLAAGSSTRFGEPKPFAVLQGETFIKRIVTAVIEADCAPVVVVTGEDSAQVTLELTRLSVSIAMNSGHRHRCRLQKALSTPSRRRRAVGIAGCSLKRIKSFRSRSQPGRPTLLRRLPERLREEMAYPYTAFGSN